MAYKNDWQKYKKLEMSKKEIFVSQLCWQGNIVTAVAETIQDLINSLDVKTSNAIEWMKDNDMIANPNKFKAIVLTKTDHNIQLVSDWNSAGKPFPLPKQLIF